VYWKGSSCLLASPLLVVLCFALAFAANPTPKQAASLSRYSRRQSCLHLRGDLWLAATSGGLATRLTAHPGVEVFAKFSPDGKWIAFTGSTTATSRSTSSRLPARPQAVDVLSRPRPAHPALGLRQSGLWVDSRRQVHCVSPPCASTSISATIVCTPFRPTVPPAGSAHALLRRRRFRFPMAPKSSTRRSSAISAPEALFWRLGPTTLHFRFETHAAPKKSPATRALTAIPCGSAANFLFIDKDDTLNLYAYDVKTKNGPAHPQHQVGTSCPAPITKADRL